MAKKRFLNPKTMAPPPGYTYVVETTGPGRTVYIAGQLGLDIDNKLVGGPGDFGEPGMGPGSGADKAAPSSDSGDKPSDSGDKPKAGGQDAAGAKAPAAEKGESASKSEGPQG